MRSITTEVYEELNKNRSGLGVNRTDVLQNLIDIIFDMQLQKDYKAILNPDEISEDLFYLVRKKQILDVIKDSYQRKDKL